MDISFAAIERFLAFGRRTLGSRGYAVVISSIVLALATSIASNVYFFSKSSRAWN